MSQPSDQKPEQIDPLTIAADLLRLKPHIYSMHDSEAEKETVMRLGAIAIRQLVDENDKLRKKLSDIFHPT